MTTDDCIKELRSSISSYPKVTELRIYNYEVIGLMYEEGEYKEFDSGIEMLEWLEDRYLDENGDHKIK